MPTLISLSKTEWTPQVGTSEQDGETPKSARDHHVSGLSSFKGLLVIFSPKRTVIPILPMTNLARNHTQLISAKASYWGLHFSISTSWGLCHRLETSLAHGQWAVGLPGSWVSHSHALIRQAPLMAELPMASWRGSPHLFFFQIPGPLTNPPKHF